MVSRHLRSSHAFALTGQPHLLEHGLNPGNITPLNLREVGRRPRPRPALVHPESGEGANAEGGDVDVGVLEDVAELRRKSDKVR